MRYVILQHLHEGVHYDLLFEAGNVLRAWKLSAPPAHQLMLTCSASFDHRTIYLDYEGPISGNRGHVLRWDWGEYSGDLTPPCSLRLEGRRLHGTLTLTPTPDGLWQLLYVDEPPQPTKRPAT